jgi:nitrogen fixation protein NifU and related proteins
MVPPPADPAAPATSGSAPDASISSLYQEIILSHYRAPRHRGLLPGATEAVEHSNPLCGDVLAIQVRTEGDRIEDAAFTARACSITQATASMLLDRVIGCTVVEARLLVAQIEALIEGRTTADTLDRDSLGDLVALASVARFPARRACVRLVTMALADAIRPR